MNFEVGQRVAIVKTDPEKAHVLGWRGTVMSRIGLMRWPDGRRADELGYEVQLDNMGRPSFEPESHLGPLDDGDGVHDEQLTEITV